MIRLTIEHGPHPGLSRAEVLRRARNVSRALQLGQSELSIVLTKDDTVQKLNRAYRNLDKPTDVLAFAMREGEAAHLHTDVLGDVVVSVETAEVQAARRGRSLLEEVTMLIVHGTLHLLGWDHDTRAKDAKMRAETTRLCRIARRRPVAASKPRPKPTSSHGRRSRGAKTTKKGE